MYICECLLCFCVFIAMVVPDRSATGWVQTKDSLQICSLRLVQPVGCCAAGWGLAGPAGGPHGWLAGSASQLFGWFSQSKVQFNGDPY